LFVKASKVVKMDDVRIIAPGKNTPANLTRHLKGFKQVGIQENLS